MSLSFDFTITMPESVVSSRGRQPTLWENDLAPIKNAVVSGSIPNGRFVASTKFLSRDFDGADDVRIAAAKEMALKMAGSIKRRLVKVYGKNMHGYNVRAWPLPGPDGAPDPATGFAVWVSYTMPSEGGSGAQAQAGTATVPEAVKTAREAKVEAKAA